MDPLTWCIYVLLSRWQQATNTGWPCDVQWLCTHHGYWKQSSMLKKGCAGAMNTDDKYDGVAMTIFKPTNYSCISTGSVYLPLSTPRPFPAVNWLACPMLSIWWKVSIEKLESWSVLSSQFTKLVGTTMRDWWYTWLEIYIPVVRDIRTLPVTETSLFLRKDCLAPNVRHLWLVGSLFSRTGVRMSC